MGDETKSKDAVVMLDFRHALGGISQREAGELLRCSGRLVCGIETGRNKIGPYRIDRLREVREAFAAGGMAAVDELPPYAKPPRHRRKGGCKAVPPEDREEMVGWRVALNLTQTAAAKQLGLSVQSIRAIEYGRMRIHERVREFMERDERKYGGR